MYFISSSHLSHVYTVLEAKSIPPPTNNPIYHKSIHQVQLSQISGGGHSGTTLNAHAETHPASPIRIQRYIQGTSMIHSKVVKLPVPIQTRRGHLRGEGQDQGPRNRVFYIGHRVLDVVAYTSRVGTVNTE